MSRIPFKTLRKKIGFIRFDLLRKALDDENKSLVVRAVDVRWYSEKLIPFSVVGFAPFSSSVLTGMHSSLWKICVHKEKDLRALNFKNALTSELKGFVHDYLHIWAYGVLQKELGDEFFKKILTGRKQEAFAYLHILTEVAASVMTDYWGFCRFDLGSHLDLGGTDRRGFQTSYSESDLSEFRRFNPDFNPFKKEFMTYFADGYLNGFFEGFSLDDLKRSEKTRSWIEHELLYSRKIRITSRDWAQFLLLTERELYRPQNNLDTEWSGVTRVQPALEVLKEQAWKWTKQSRGFRLPHARIDFPNQKPRFRKNMDFRFINFNHFKISDLSKCYKLAEPGSRPNLLYQFISRFNLEDFSQNEIQKIRILLKDRNVAGLKKAIRKKKPLPVSRFEPLVIFIDP